MRAVVQLLAFAAFALLPAFAVLAIFTANAAPTLAQMVDADPAAQFAQASADQDGRVSMEAFRVARAARFDQLDRNHDGYLDEADLPPLAHTNRVLAQKFRAMLRVADADHDGRISREEFVAAGARLFERLDANHDGYVDRDEIRLATQQLHALAVR